jgi:hypothetical protein
MMMMDRDEVNDLITTHLAPLWVKVNELEKRVGEMDTFIQLEVRK